MRIPHETDQAVFDNFSNYTAQVRQLCMSEFSLLCMSGKFSDLLILFTFNKKFATAKSASKALLLS